MQRKRFRANGLALLAMLAAAGRVMAQQPAAPYPKMAPMGQYLMNRPAEIALARSAAPASISRHAEVLVLGRHGFETAIHGTNGWVCMVARSWGGPFDWPEFWNPRIRAASCVNPAAAHFLVPQVLLRTKLLLAGDSRVKVIAVIGNAFRKKQLPAPGPGGVSYMMARASYLTDSAGHNAPHIMFYAPTRNLGAWGGNFPGSPLLAVNFWYGPLPPPRPYPRLRSFLPLAVFLVGVGKWSDGTPAPGR